MKRHRTITSLAALAALVVSMAIAATAHASSLLSGYGGPGQGNQAILGSTLLGGGSGGGGGGPAATSGEGTGSSSQGAGSATASGGSASHSTRAGTGRSR